MTDTNPMEERKPDTEPNLTAFARRNGISPTVAKAILDNVGGDFDKAFGRPTLRCRMGRSFAFPLLAADAAGGLSLMFRGTVTDRQWQWRTLPGHLSLAP